MNLLLPEIPRSYERFSVLIVYGILMLLAGFRDNIEAAAAWGVAITTYFLSREDV
jgi:hypothetical protein